MQSKIVLKMVFRAVNETIINQFWGTAAASYGVDIEKVEVEVLLDTFTGETTHLLTVRTVMDTSDVSFTVEIISVFPLFPSNFISHKPAYISSVSNVASVSFNKVAVKSIFNTTPAQRRLLASQINVKFTVTVSSLAAASLNAEKSTMANLNAEFAPSGLSTGRLSVSASVASVASKAAQKLATSRAQGLDNALVALNFKTPTKQVIYLDAVITIDGEMHSKNNNTVVLLYLLCIFLIALMILLLLWARKNFGVAKDSNCDKSYDAMKQDT